MTADEQREAILVSLNRQELWPLFGLDPVGDPADSGVRLDVRLARIPRTLPDDSFSRELYAHEDELFSWLAADPESGKAFIADPRASFQTATRASGEFLERMTSMEKGEPDQADIASVVPAGAAAQISDTWTRKLSPPTRDAICLLNTADYVYAGSNGILYKLRAADGTVESFIGLDPAGKNKGAVRLAISGDGKKLFIGNRGCVTCVNTGNLSRVWRTRFDKRKEIVNLILRGTVLYAGTRGKVYQLSYEDGHIMRHNDLKGRGNNEVRLALSDDGSRLFIGTRGWALGLLAGDLRTEWQTRLERTGTNPITILTRRQYVYAAGNGRLFKLTFGNGRLFKLTVKGAVERNKRRGDRNVRMQFSPDGKSLLLGTNGYALSVDATNLKKRWQTSLMDKRGTAVSVLLRAGVLPQDDVLYAGNCGHFLRLNLEKGFVTFKKPLGGGGKQEVGMALSPDGAHLRLACNGFVTQTPAAGDLSAGWQAIAATRRSRLNETLRSLFDAGAIPQTIESPFKLGGKDCVARVSIIAAPEIIGGGSGQATLKVALRGEIAPGGGWPKLAKLDGYVELTVDLESIQARIEEEERSQDFQLAIGLVSDALFDTVDLSHLKVVVLRNPIKLSNLEPVLLFMLNEAARGLLPLQFTVQKPLPVSLNGLVVRFTYTNVPGDAGKDFLSILFGLPYDVGSFALSPSIIGDRPDTDTAFIFANRLIMETIKAGLIAAQGGSDFGFVVSDAYPAHVSNSRGVLFNDVKGVRLRIDKGYVQIFIRGTLEANVSVSWRSWASGMLWHAVHLESTTSFASEGGDIRLTFVSKADVPWTFFLNVFPLITVPLMAYIKKRIHSLVDGEWHAPIFVPGFDVTDISLPAYVQITGKANRNKKR